MRREVVRILLRNKRCADGCCIMGCAGGGVYRTAVRVGVGLKTVSRRIGTCADCLCKRAVLSTYDHTAAHAVQTYGEECLLVGFTMHTGRVGRAVWGWVTCGKGRLGRGNGSALPFPSHDCTGNVLVA